MNHARPVVGRRRRLLRSVVVTVVVVVVVESLNLHVYNQSCRSTRRCSSVPCQLLR